MWTRLTELLGAASATLLALVALSVLALGIGLERLATTQWHRRRLRQGRASILGQLRDGKPQVAAALHATLPAHPASALFALLLAPVPTGAGATRRALGRLVRAARRRLWVLGSIGSIAPFVGLLGTVLGVMEAFRAIGASGGGGFQVVSAGISEALVTTAAGIFVGVEAVLFFNLLQVVVAAYAAELREAVEEIAEALPEAQRGAAGT